jgi:PadR family transcriptional regulator, regulatory protein PadR
LPKIRIAGNEHLDLLHISDV